MILKSEVLKNEERLDCSFSGKVIHRLREKKIFTNVYHTQQHKTQMNAVLSVDINTVLVPMSVCVNCQM